MDTKSTAWLATQRLMLRPLGTDDGDALHALLVQPGVRRYLFDGVVPGRPEVDAMAIESRRRFAGRGAGLWLVFEIACPGTPAGIAGFRRFPHRVGRFPADELVFALDESCWGRGLAAEASHAVLQHVRDALGWPEARASADDGNLASARTLARLGFRESGIEVRARQRAEAVPEVAAMKSAPDFGGACHPAGAGIRAMPRCVAWPLSLHAASAGVDSPAWTRFPPSRSLRRPRNCCRRWSRTSPANSRWNRSCSASSRAPAR